MKKLFSILTLLICISGYSANKIDSTGDRAESATITIAYPDAKTDYPFNSIKDFSNYSDAIIESAGETGVPTAMVTITISVTSNASAGMVGGPVSTTVSGSVTTSCAGAVATGKKLRDRLIAMASGN